MLAVTNQKPKQINKTKNQSIDQHTTGKSLQGPRWEEINIILKYCEQLSYFLLAAPLTSPHIKTDGMYQYLILAIGHHVIFLIFTRRHQ